MVRAAAAEFGPAGVRVNAVAPGVIETPLTRSIKDLPAWYAAYAEKTVLKRWGTGSLLVVDGGWTAADGRFVPPGM